MSGKRRAGCTPKLSTLKRALLIAAVVVVQGCAGNPPGKYSVFAPDAMAALRGKPLQVKTLPTPAFIRSTTADEVMTSMMVSPILMGIGAGAMAHMAGAGHAIIEEDAIADPTQRLAERVEALLASKYGSSVGDSRYRVTVSTDRWSLVMDDLVYYASVKVTDEGTRPARVLALGECRFSTVADKAKPDADELLRNHGEKLKQVLDRALDDCVRNLDEKVFP